MSVQTLRARRRRHLDTLRTAFWLGWKVESNWTDPLLYVGYAIIRPVAASLLLVFMFLAVTGRAEGGYVDFLVIGTAFWPFGLAGVRGMVHGLLEDREQFQTIRALYTTPISYRVYLVGRALAVIAAVAGVSAIVTLVIGGIWLDVSYRISPASLGMAAVAMVVGVVAMLALGVLAASLVLHVTREAWHLPEGLAAALYLLSGAIYPVTVLPAGIEWIARALPIAWWLEAMRRALTPAAPQQFPAFSDAAVLGILALLTLAFASVSWMLFRLSERRARRVGAFDERSGY